MGSLTNLDRIYRFKNDSWQSEAEGEPYLVSAMLGMMQFSKACNDDGQRHLTL